MGYRVTLSHGMAGRVASDDIIGDWEKPRFGFYWWFWLPAFKSNGGKFRMSDCVDVGVCLFCFWLDFIFWPTERRGLTFGFSASDRSPKKVKCADSDKAD